MNKKESECKAIWIIITEILFAILPIIVISFVLILNGKFSELFNKSELSFVAVVLFGQTLIRFLSGIAKSTKRKKWFLMSFYAAIIFVIGVIPSVILLITIYQNTNLQDIIFIFQIVWFILSIITYIIFGTIGQMYLEENLTSEEK